MATRTATVNNSTVHALLVTWTGLLNGDQGDAIELPDWADRCIQITGTFGASGNMRFEGSLDGTNWFPITDPQGNAINLTAAGGEALTEVTKYVRPNVTAGDGTTSLTVMMYARRNR
jgi:hypothetical protein